MQEIDTRSRIIAAADQLFYQQGFEHTSFAHIADAVKISRGNFYHHFKSKDEILAAVIALRLEKTQALLDQWQANGETPGDRIRSFIHILIMNKTKIKQFGCPVGTLCTELAKLEHAAQPDANKVFTLFHTWLQKQFVQLGQKKEANSLAMHLLARSQGIATLANAFHDEKFIKHEVNLLLDWLNTYTNPNGDATCSSSS